MKTFCVASVGSIIGIILGLYLNCIASFYLVCTIIATIIIMIIAFIKIFFKKYYKYAIIFCIVCIIFFSYTTFLEKQYENKLKIYGNQEVKVQAIIVSNAIEKDYKITYEIKVINIQNLKNGEKTNKPFKMLCNIKKNKESMNDLKYGDKIEFIANYEIPSCARNEGGFDYRQYLKANKILGIFNIKELDITKLGESKENIIKTVIHNLKNNLIEKIKNTLPKDESGLCIALLLGDKTDISEEISQSFRKSSLSHMLAISGAHVSYILLGITTFFNTLKFHKRWSKIFIILFLIFFMALVDFTPSVTRACIMCILTLSANILFQKPNVYQNLAISSLIILIMNPYTLLDIGFQLSYGGTIGIVIFMGQKENKVTKNEQIKSVIKKQINNIYQIIKVSLAANVIIFPIMIYHFNTVSATFLISNILASQILGVCLIMAMIFIILLIIINPIAKIFSFFLIPILQILIQIANITSSLPFSQILLPTPKIWQIVLYYILLFFIFKYKKNSFDKVKLLYRKKLICIVLILLIIFPYFAKKMPSNYLKIYNIDVGQGDSFLIETPSKKKILIDGGGSEMGSFDVGEKTLLPYLLDKGILSIDYIMFSHFDSDHCQGLFTILEKLKVKNIIISKQGEFSNNFKNLFEIIKSKKVNVIIVQAGNKIQIDKNCYFDILFPQKQLITSNVLNNNSIVAKFVMKCNNNTFSMLFTGDVEQIAENKLVELYGNTNNLQSTILKVAHHGSKTSSSVEFLELVKPQIALIRSRRK